MVTCCCEFQSLEALRQYVYEILCERNQLQVGAFEMTEDTLWRGNRPCGILYCLHGPRAVKFTAIWETDRNRILFYGCEGQRFQKTDLREAPDLLRRTAAAA